MNDMMIKMFNSKRVLSLGIVMAAMLMIDMAAAANYTVGAPGGGWDQSTDLQTWASAITFYEGDNLIFQYTTNHDVTEVSKPDFDSCSASNPLQPPLTGGAAVVPLTSAGSRYFMCSTGGHCLSGMKVSITTATATSAAPSPSSTPAAAPPPSSTPDVPSPPPKYSPSKTVSPSPSPKHSPPPSVSAEAPPRSGSPPPAPSSAAKFGVMGGVTVTGVIVMINFLINV